MLRWFSKTVSLPVSVLAVVLGCIVLLLAVLFSRYDLVLQPKPPSVTGGCTMEVKLCPDGSTTVVREGPRCEFSPCPVGGRPKPITSYEECLTAQERVFVEDPPSCTIYPEGTTFYPTQPVVVGPAVTSKPEEYPMYSVPDLPITGQLPSPATVRWVVEHRSALNGRTISVRGVVVQLVENPKCAEGSPCVGMYVQPGIMLADTADPARDQRYDLRVSLNTEPAGYVIGSTVIVTGEVAGSRILDVTLRSTETE